jgi:hypothetical protein
MALELIGPSGNIADVDSDKHLMVSVHPPAFGALGAYTVAVATGNIAATLAAGSTLFSCRWGDATRLMLLKEVWCMGIVTGAITTAVNFDLEAVVARNFTGSDTGGTAISLAGSNNKRRTSMGSSLVTDMRVASTAALTAGTRTPDTQAFGRLQGFTGTAQGTKIFDASLSALWEADVNQYDFVFAQNEGFLIRNPLAGPATGTISLAFRIEWSEATAY